jgi:hypothetical protein
LWLEEHDEDVVVLTVSGGVAAHRAGDLWSAIEGALEVAAGRLVVAELSAVTVFDLGTLDALDCVARAATRRHDDVCAVMRSDSPLHQYAQIRGLAQRLLIHTTMSAVVGPADGDAVSAGRAA